MNQPIGIFDSGMGGLTVLRALRRQLPNESFVYLGDTARLPYGTKSGETVSRYAVQAAAALVTRGIKLLVIACNTASAYALPAVQDFAVVPVIGVIDPGARAAVAAAAQGPIAVIATEGTVKGGAYARAIRTIAPAIEVVQQPCPLFVPLAEEGLTKGDIAEAVARHYLAPLCESRPRCLVLGCTHFPVLKGIIAQTIGTGIALVDSAETTALMVETTLRERNLLNGGAAGGTTYLVTDAADRFVRVGQTFLGESIDTGSVEIVDLQ
ncbi:MAG: glutamate racemase [Alphaproteobacteria bacterium]|nr:glutamate racemase [Alphaproteobacteria bacterium]MBV9062890.1 glutamate racemase [Alphaproteobacteria bacterium]